MRCQFFQVTWQTQYPYACVMLGFKSKHYPSITVKQSSGDDCRYFKEKERVNNDEKTL